MKKRYYFPAVEGHDWLLLSCEKPTGVSYKTLCKIISSTKIDIKVETKDLSFVKHAYWRRATPFVDTIECSNCSWQEPTEEFATPYCPDCGAKMDNPYDFDDEDCFEKDEEDDGEE